MLNGLGTLKRQLKPLLLPAKQRRALLRQTGAAVKKMSQRRISEQRDLEGRPFAPRKNKARRKMLRGFKRLLVVKSDANNAVIMLRNDVAGRLARIHQDGITRTSTVAQLKALDKGDPKTMPATRRQARALREAGYQVRRPSGKGLKPPTLKWITDNLHQKQAGVILRLFRGDTPKHSWPVPVASRSFLGASRADVDNLMDDIADTLTGQIKRA